MKIKSLVAIFIIIFIGCKDEFFLTNDGFEPVLVVDGMITNEKGPYTIKITQSSPVNDEAKDPMEKCTVTLYENNTKIDILREQSPGIYKTSGNIQGKIGNSYMIHIATPEVKEYETEPQILNAPVEIESVYSELVYENDEDYANGLPGYQFYIDSKEAPAQESFFLWQMNETYQYNNDYKVIDFFLGYDYRYDMGELVLHEIENDTLLIYLSTKVYTCWRTKDLGFIVTGKTSNLNTSQISKQPLHFVGTDSKRLTQRYSTLITQYNITKEAYTYWNAIEEQSSNENFLVSNQPYSISGNIKNTNDPSELVFGYFTVASVSKKRIFVDPPNESFYLNKCDVVTDPVMVNEMIENDKPPFYFVQTVNGEGIVNKNCIDCRNEGGTNIKPDFWED